MSVMYRWHDSQGMARPESESRLVSVQVKYKWCDTQSRQDLRVDWTEI